MKLEETYMTADGEACNALSSSPKSVRKVLVVHASVGSGHKSAVLAIQKACDMLDAQAELEAVMEITRTADCREGIRAFLDKRQPSYRGPGYGDLGTPR